MANVRTVDSSFGFSLVESFDNVKAAVAPRLSRCWQNYPEIRDDIPTELYLSYTIAYEEVQQGKKINNFIGYVYLIAYRRLVKNYHSLKHRWENENTLADTVADSKMTLPLPDSRIRDIAEVINSLPPDKRQMATLRFIQGLSYREIGDKMGMNGDAVKTAVCRIKKDMQKELLL